jgi:hypothetical protein
MKKIIVNISLLFLLFSCNNNPCENTIQKERIMGYINAIEEYFITGERRTHDEYLYHSVRCISMLDEITPIESQVSLGNIATYKFEWFQEDKKGWINWANKNSCKLENEYLDSLEFKYKINEIPLELSNSHNN